MSVNPETEQLLERLIEADVLAERDDRLELTESFREARDEANADLRSKSEDDRRAARETVAETLGFEADIVDLDLVATARALQSFAGLEAPTAARVAVSLKRFDAPETGVPPGFTPINAEEIGAFLADNPVSVIYCWREDCDPCDLVREDIAELRDDGTIPDEMGLAAVYGPTSPRVLAEEYEVTVAPTTLFCAEGRVDARLIGAHDIRTLRNEIEIIAESL